MSKTHGNKKYKDQYIKILKAVKPLLWDGCGHVPSWSRPISHYYGIGDALRGLFSRNDPNLRLLLDLIVWVEANQSEFQSFLDKRAQESGMNMVKLQTYRHEWLDFLIESLENS